MADGGAPGMKPGAQPVLRERFGTRRLKSRMCESSSSSTSSALSSPVFLRFAAPEDEDTPHAAMSSVCRISARTPQTAAVSPTLTTALPFVCVSEPAFAEVTRNWNGERPLARIDG